MQNLADPVQTQYKLALQEKLTTLTQLNGEILEEEIDEQADVLKERFRLVMINVFAVGTWRTPVLRHDASFIDRHGTPMDLTTSGEPTTDDLVHLLHSLCN